MVICYLAGVFGLALLFLWWATKPGTYGKDGGLQTKDESRNDSMI